MVKLVLFKAEQEPICLIVRVQKKAVEFIKWELESDTFIPGQWLLNKQFWSKGSSISPCGKYFFYVYNTYQSRDDTHAVVSKIPNATGLLYGNGGAGRWNGTGFDFDSQPIDCGHQLKPTRHADDISINQDKFSDLEVGGFVADNGLIEEDVWEDPGGRMITCREGKLYANDQLIYDTTDHVFQPKIID